MTDAGVALSPFPWRRELRNALLVGLVPLGIVLVFMAAAPGFSVSADDGQSQFRPVAIDSIRQILSGKLPLWSDHTACGYPLLARGQQSLYPPLLLSHAIGWAAGFPDQGIVIAYLLHLFLGTTLAFLYIRFVGAGPGPALIGAWGYGLSGPLMGFWVNWPNYGYLPTWLLLAVLIIERLRHGPAGSLWSWLFGLDAGMVLLITDPVLIIKFCLFVTLYFLLRLRRDCFRAMVVPLAWGSVYALLIGAGQVVATYQFVSGTLRVTAAGRGDPHFLSVMPEAYVGLFFPFAELPWPDSWPNYDDITLGAVFFGPLFALALLVPLAFPRRTNFVLDSQLFILFAFYLILSFGAYTVVGVWMAELPVFRHFRWPLRWTLELGVLAPLFIGVRMGLVEQSFAGPGLRRILIGFVALLLAAIGATMRIAPGGMTALTWTARVVWLAGSVLLLICVLHRQRRAFSATAVAFSLIALILNVPAANRNRFSQPDLSNLYHDPIELAGDPHQRVLFLATRREQRDLPGEGNFAYELPHYFGGRTVLGYRARLSTQIWSGSFADDLGDVLDEEAAIRTFLKSHLLDVCRVGHVVVVRTNTLLRQACDRHPKLVPALETKYLRVYRHTGFQAPAFFVRRLLDEPQPFQPEDLGQIALKEYAYVPADFDGSREYAGQGEVEGFWEHQGTLGMKTRQSQPGFLVITTTWFPGWKATVDGVEVPIYRTDASFMGIRVPAGEHTVELRFRPWTIIVLVIVGVITEAALTLACLVHVLGRLPLTSL